MIGFGGEGLAGPVPQQLPADVRGFVNRFTEFDELDSVFSEAGELDASACVIAGTAGVGKTSFAVRWAWRARDRFPDGQLYVDLHGYDLRDPVSAVRALERFLIALGVPEGAIPLDVEARAALYRSRLAGKRVLVVLDNAASVADVRLLLPGAPGCLAVVTSRSRLSGLVARDGARRITLEVFPEREAVELLQVTAGRYRSGDDAGEVAELARLCARLPLALRIAAERAAARPKMPLRDLIQDLRDESELWAALSSEDEGEADAVRTVFAWSYRALTSDAARLFRLLGLHPGPEFGIHVAAALTGESQGQARHLLDVLSGAHLIEQISRDRYRFHDLLRAYAADQAMHEESGQQRDEAVQRVLEWYLHAAHHASTVLGESCRGLQTEGVREAQSASLLPKLADRDAAVSWFETEWAGLRAVAIRAALLGADRLVWQLSITFRGYYQIHNAFEGRLAMGQDAVAAARRDGDRLGEAESLKDLAVCTFQLDRPGEALELHRSALPLHREAGDREGEAYVLNSMGFAFYKLRQFAQASTQHRQAAALFNAIGNEGWELSAIRNAIEAELELGIVPAGADDVLKSGLAAQRAAGLVADQVDTLIVFSRLGQARGEADAALAMAESAVLAAREAVSMMLEGYALLKLGSIQLSMGRATGALESFHRAIVVHRESGAPGREAEAFDGTGAALASLDRFDEAIGFHRRAITVFRELGLAWRQAVALGHLAYALDCDGSREEAREARREALGLITQFEDVQALEMRAQLDAALAC